MNCQNNSSTMTNGLVVALIIAIVLVGVTVIPTIRADSLTFSTIDPPGSMGTLALDINASGNIVGNYLTADGKAHGFLLSKGTFTTIDVPGAGLLSEANGINDAGEIVGIWGLLTEEHGYVLNKGTFTTTDFPGAVLTFFANIDNRGDVVGGYLDSAGIEHGLLFSDGILTTIDFPDAVSFTTASDINSAGQIVGNYDDASGNRHGFLLNDGEFTLIDFPDASSTEVFGINASGEIVGRYALDGQDPFFAGHGFLLKQGVFTTIDFPGATSTAAARINAHGEVVGQYMDVNGIVHGFVTSSVAEL
jgi:probable HAF family extracellular repeat protein